MAEAEKNAGQGKAPGEGSLHTGLNSLLSAREGKAEGAHGAGLERGKLREQDS